MVGLKTRSLKKFLSTIWAYLSVLLSDSYVIEISDTFERLMATLWLLMCTLILSAFAGQLWNRLYRPPEPDFIKSWDDLHSKQHAKHLNIQTLEYLELDNMLRDNSKIELYDETKDQVMDFKQRIHKQKPSIILNFSISAATELFDWDGVIDNKKAVVMEFTFLNMLKQILLDKGKKEDIDFHISEEGSGSQPYFFLLNRANFDHKMARALNFM